MFALSPKETTRRILERRCLRPECSAWAGLVNEYCSEHVLDAYPGFTPEQAWDALDRAMHHQELDEENAALDFADTAERHELDLYNQAFQRF